jgi:hypothetical protein
MSPSAQWIIGGITACGTGAGFWGLVSVDQLAQYHVYFILVGLLCQAIGVFCFTWAVYSARFRRSRKKKRQEVSLQKAAAEKEEIDFLNRIAGKAAPNTPSLESESPPPPPATVNFDWNGRIVYLTIKNSGPPAIFWAKLKVNKWMRDMPSHEVFARWEHVQAAKALIYPGESYSLIIGRLELHDSMGTWHVPYTSEDRASEAHSYSSWFLGEHYEYQSNQSAVIVTVALYRYPELQDGPITYRIKLKGEEPILMDA